MWRRSSCIGCWQWCVLILQIPSKFWINSSISRFYSMDFIKRVQFFPLVFVQFGFKRIIWFKKIYRKDIRMCWKNGSIGNDWKKNMKNSLCDSRNRKFISKSKIRNILLKNFKERFFWIMRLDFFPFIPFLLDHPVFKIFFFPMSWSSRNFLNCYLW